MAAIQHRQPENYYRQWADIPELCWWPAQHTWVTGHPQRIGEILHHPACAVRPPAERVPIAMQETRLGQIFARLLRMNDDPARQGLKLILVKAMAEISQASLADTTLRAWKYLVGHPQGFSLSGDVEKASWADIACHYLPCLVLGELLGLRWQRAPQWAPWVQDFANALAPGAPIEVVTRGGEAAEALWQEFLPIARQVRSGPGQPCSVLLLRLLQGADSLSPEESLLWGLANGLGLMFQARDSMAATLPLLFLDEEEELRGSMPFGAPIQNTRRFVTAPCRIGQVSLCAGDKLLLLLAAAVHQDKALAWGDGPHRCPGQSWVETLVTASRAFLSSAANPGHSSQWQHVGFRASLNARIPLLREVKA